MGHTVPEPETPDGAEHLIEWFWTLSASRQQGMSGPLPISFSEIQAWSSLTGEIVTREEVAILRAMDDGFLTGIEEWRVWCDGLRDRKPTMKKR